MKLSKSDFYNWAYSDLLVNVNRGRFAEYIVATALGIADTERQEWEAYDLQFQDIRIEVKSSAYIQGWNQHGKISKLVFGIRPTFAYDDNIARYQDASMRQSDVYVFCVLKHTDHKTIAPEDMTQWEFYIVPTRLLNEKCTTQKTITLSALKRLFNVSPVAYQDIKSEIVKSMKPA